jgi:hypothetical protein
VSQRAVFHEGSRAARLVHDTNTWKNVLINIP